MLSHFNVPMPRLRIEQGDVGRFAITPSGDAPLLFRMNLTDHYDPNYFGWSSEFAFGIESNDNRPYAYDNPALLVYFDRPRTINTRQQWIWTSAGESGLFLPGLFLPAPVLRFLGEVPPLAATPEPSSWGLMVLGALAIYWLRLKERHVS
jgi:hypothetical protein